MKFVTADGTDKFETSVVEGKEVKTLVEAARKIELEFNFGETLEEAIELYGKEVVFSAYVASAKVDAQALVRRYLKSNVPAVEGVSTERPYTDDEIAAKLASWKPGVKTDRGTTSVADQAEKILGKMTDAQKAEFLKKLQEMAG